MVFGRIICPVKRIYINDGDDCVLLPLIKSPWEEDEYGTFYLTHFCHVKYTGHPYCYLDFKDAQQKEEYENTPEEERFNMFISLKAFNFFEKNHFHEHIIKRNRHLLSYEYANENNYYQRKYGKSIDQIFYDVKETAIPEEILTMESIGDYLDHLLIPIVPNRDVTQSSPLSIKIK
jgi:hypothetical protein